MCCTPPPHSFLTGVLTAPELAAPGFSQWPQEGVKGAQEKPCVQSAVLSSPEGTAGGTGRMST